jgi:hypothetical protein
MKSSGRTTLDEVKAFGRYARRLPSFLRETMTPELGREVVRRQLERREQTFLTILDGGVYRNPRSPYLTLLRAAGIELGDVVKLIDQHGLEGALAALRDAGVYATLDEFKGRGSIERPGLSLEVEHIDFDNPLIVSHYWVKTGGSRAARRRVPLDLNLLDHDAAHEALFQIAYQVRGRPVAMWRVKPPSTGGIKHLLYQAKLGQPVERWFDPYRAPLGIESLKYWLFTAYSGWAGRLHGSRLVRPEHCSAEQAMRIVEWLRARKDEGRPALMDAQTGLAVRLCNTAVAEGIDISDTFFRLGGEPLTRAKGEVISTAGCQAASHYSTTETGRVAVPCPNPDAPDDMHFLVEKLAVLRQEKVIGSSGETIGGLSYTTLLPSTPKIMINVESDDFGVLEERSCGCQWDRLGLSLHLHGVRSHEKLTTDGNNFLGSDLFALIEEVLPDRFGGGPTDYQLVEEEVDGLSRVSVVVRPAIGTVPDQAILSAVMDFMRAKSHNRLMADFWQQSNTVRVVRREPHVTAAGKSPPLYVQHTR